MAVILNLRMDCFIDIVGIKNCTGEIMPTGGWINSLPGISLESIDRIANDEQISFAGVWVDIQQEAARRFESDFMGSVSECYELNAYCDYDEMACANIPKLTNAWRYLLGNQLMLERLFSTRINRFTTVDREQAVELRDFYQIEYEKALKQASKLLIIDDCCLICNANPQTVTWLP